MHHNTPLSQDNGDWREEFYKGNVSQDKSETFSFGNFPPDSFRNWLSGSATGFIVCGVWSCCILTLLTKLHRKFSTPEAGVLPSYFFLRDKPFEYQSLSSLPSSSTCLSQSKKKVPLSMQEDDDSKALHCTDSSWMKQSFE